MVQEPSGNSPVSMPKFFWRQAHVMAHGLGLGEAGQADLALALEPAETRRERLRLVEIDAGRVGAADLEDQRLLLLAARGCR